MKIRNIIISEDVISRLQALMEDSNKKPSGLQKKLSEIIRNVYENQQEYQVEKKSVQVFGAKAASKEFHILTIVFINSLIKQHSSFVLSSYARKVILNQIINIFSYRNQISETVMKYEFIYVQAYNVRDKRSSRSTGSFTATIPCLRH